MRRAQDAARRTSALLYEIIENRKEKKKDGVWFGNLSIKKAERHPWQKLNLTRRA
jgi:hypothetical protein